MLFDIWIRDNGTVTYTPEQELLFKTIWEYVYDRIAFLATEMDSEEDGEVQPKKAVVIYLLERPNKIQPKGYSDRLCEKINGCFNERDAELLWKSVADKLTSFLN